MNLFKGFLLKFFKEKQARDMSLGRHKLKFDQKSEGSDEEDEYVNKLAEDLIKQHENAEEGAEWNDSELEGELEDSEVEWAGESFEDRESFEDIENQSSEVKYYIKKILQRLNAFYIYKSFIQCCQNVKNKIIISRRKC